MSIKALTNTTRLSLKVDILGMKRNITKRAARHRRVRAKISGVSSRPRLSVFRSNGHISAQLIDDTLGVTLASANDKELKSSKISKLEIASAVGKLLAKKANDKNINTVVFDRGGYAYRGRVKALADGAREGGLKF